MKYFIYILPIFSLFFIFSCEKPCQKAYEKTVECSQGAGLKKSLQNHKEVIIKLCKPYEDEVKSCLKHEKCGEFNLCMRKATKHLVNKKELNKNKEEIEAKEIKKNEKKKPLTPKPDTDMTK